MTDELAQSRHSETPENMMEIFEMRSSLCRRARGVGTASCRCCSAVNRAGRAIYRLACCCVKAHSPSPRGRSPSECVASGSGSHVRGPETVPATLTGAPIPHPEAVRNPEIIGNSRDVGRCPGPQRSGAPLRRPRIDCLSTLCSE
jgi:hypothetical protein